jgi:hypothetical protein
VFHFSIAQKGELLLAFPLISIPPKRLLEAATLKPLANFSEFLLKSEAYTLMGKLREEINRIVPIKQSLKTLIISLTTHPHGNSKESLRINRMV